MRATKLLLGVSCGAACAFYATITPEKATCDASHFPQSASSHPPHLLPRRPLPATAVALADLRRWLERRGVDLSGVDIRAVVQTEPLTGPQTPAVGRFALVANAEAQRRTSRSALGPLLRLVGLGRGEVTLATFPLHTSAMHAVSLSKIPRQGPIIRELIQRGAADERDVVILHLAVERARGESSTLYPWLSLMPGSFDTPLFWSEEELRWLRGTPLHKATALRKKALRDAWTRLQPAAAQLMVAEESEDEIPLTFDDYLWAYSVFWSRSVELPIAPGVKLDGLVPGLDFANHAHGCCCRWKTVTNHAASVAPLKRPVEVEEWMKQTSRSAAAAHAPENMEAAVQLVCPKACCLMAGTEVTIDYGGKSNEQLLFLYGFVENDDPHAALMVACPLPPPNEWDAVLERRVMLLQQRGLAPQIFLPGSHLSMLERNPRNSRRSSLWGWLFPRSGSAQRKGAVAESELPKGVMETLEVFVMDPKDVERELQREGRGKALAGRPTGHGSGKELGAVEASGLRMALLTTLSRLLKIKVVELEGSEEGTGSLEEDEKLLEGGRLGRRERAAVVYRSGQKRLARAYLKLCNELLSREMEFLRSVA